MSGSSAPATATYTESDIADGMEKGLQAILEWVGKAAHTLLPFGLDGPAAAAVMKLCGELSAEVERLDRDAQAVLAAKFERLSTETLKQLAELAKKTGQAESTTPKGLGQPVGPVALPDILKLPGDSQKRIRLPVKFSSGPDIHLLLNHRGGVTDPGALKLTGVGLGVRQPAGPVTIKGGVMLQLVTPKPSTAGFVEIEMRF